mgnify:CR=1 FL=1
MARLTKQLALLQLLKDHLLGLGKQLADGEFLRLPVLVIELQLDIAPFQNEQVRA